MKLSSDTSVRYHTKIDDRLGGPYTVEGLESLVYLEKISPETLISPEGADTFAPIKTTALWPVLYPQIAQPAAAKNWAPPGQPNDPANPHRKHYRFTEAKFEKVNGTVAETPKVDVFKMLDEIRQTEVESGFDEIRPRRFRISKRSRDFWIMLIAGNALLIGGGLLMQNVASLIFAIGGSGMFTFGLLWSMYGVMGKY